MHRHRHNPGAARWMRSLSAALAAAATIAFVAVLLPVVAEAHERREVNGGSQSFVVGFMSEPAYEGEQNGVDLRVTRGDGEPVEGLEQTLRVEVTHDASGASAELPLRALFGQSGRYTADLVPTASGAYQFRVFGEIDGHPVDETFLSRSLGGGFNDVEAIAAIQFPETLASARELQGAVGSAREAARAAEDAAAAARTLAMAGVALGILGVAAGGAGVALGLRRR